LTASDCNPPEPAVKLSIPSGHWKGRALFEADLIWPVLGAILIGGLIGLEREYRSSPAGFRTHILVSLSSALLMLAAVHQVRWLSDTPVDIIRIDPVRMAHGILTGIGFLCGGVIFREGFTVRGLTTAASLWSTSALGVLFGVGFTGLAVLGGLATLLVLAAVGVTEGLMPQRQHADIRMRFRRDAPVDAGEFRRLLADHDLKAEAITQSLDAEAVAYSTTVSRYTEARAEALVATVRLTPSVIAFECEPRRA
jgi:putative Mg2+ transporter-C (MgtC) family protein